MKKTHLLVSSMITVLLSASLIAGATYSLFTSESTHDITVSSGKVNVESYISPDLTLKSIGIEQTGTFANGGTASLVENTLSLVNITPGDSVTFVVGVKNFSTVKTRYRISLKLDNVDGVDLFDALVITPDLNKNWSELLPDANPDNPTAEETPITITLPTEAGNDYQGLSCKIKINVEAVQGNADVSSMDIAPTNIDDALKARKLNTMLGKMPTKASNMSEAATFLEGKGTDIEALVPAIETNTFLWDQDNNEFVVRGSDGTFIYPSVVTTSDLHLWKVVDKYEPDTSYSQYLRDKDFVGPDLTFTVDTGIDIGKNTEAFSITYEGTANDSLIIKTSSAKSNLVINTQNSDVSHYGPLGKLTVKEVPNQCYFEFGQTSYAEVNKGKVVAKKGGTISLLLSDPSAGSVVIVNSDLGEVTKAYALTQEISNNHTGNVELTYEPAKDKQAIVSEGETIVSNAIEQENLINILHITGAGTDEYASLLDFRDSVNSGTTYAGKTITLMRDANLSSIPNWIPIGTPEHPFTGVFDGNNKTISNAHIKGVGDLGLFGVTSGTANSSNLHTSADLEKLWNGTEFSEESIAETKYETVIKNLKLDNFTTDVDVVDHGTNRRYGALVGKAECSYIKNVHVTNSTIVGHTYVGSIAGVLNQSILYGSSSDANTKVMPNVTSPESGVQKYCGNSGGLVGGSINHNNGLIFINNTNNAVLYNDTITGGAFGGIIGLNNTPVFFFNNTNNANILRTNITGTGGISYVGGIGGSTSARNFHVNSVNNGNIDVDAVKCIGGIQGLSNNTGSYYYETKNNGTINGNTLKMGGLVGEPAADKFTFISCDVAHHPVNTNQAGSCSLYGGTMKNSKFTNTTFNTTADLSNAIKDSETVELINVTVTGSKTPLVLPAKLYLFKSNTEYSNYCSGIKYEDNNYAGPYWDKREVELSVPNLTYTITSSNPNTQLNFSGSNNVVTLDTGATIKKLKISGTGTTALIKTGAHVTSRGLIFGEASSYTIEEGAEVNGLSIGGTTEKHIINRGLITTKNNAGNYHAVSCTQATPIIFDNYGTILNSGMSEQQKTTSYALLFYNESVVTFNAYSTSKVETAFAKGTYLVSAGTVGAEVNRACTSLEFNVQEGAQLISNGIAQKWSFTHPRITVKTMQ